MVNKEKMKAFDEALKKITSDNSSLLKSETGNLISKLSEKPINVESISTGSLVLDSVLGGGFPKGRIIEIFGKESSGKTSIALTAIANVQRDGGTAAFIDFENALDPSYAKKIGVDIENLAVSQPDYAEQGMELVQKLAESGVVDIIVIDSVAALVPKLELEGDLDQNSIGLVARILSRTLKKLVSAANRTGTTVVLINQKRVAIGKFSPFGTPEDTTGGNALKYYTSQRIEVNRKGQIKDGKDFIGNEVRFKIVKNKVAPPFKEGTTVLTFGSGINRAAELVTVGPEFGVIEMPNNRTYVEAATGKVFAKSRAEAVEKLENDKELFDRLSAQLKKVLETDEAFNKVFRKNSDDSDTENE